MAVQTIILRPSATQTYDDTSGLVRFPTETEDAELHLLVSEITADDDATYVQADYGETVVFNFPNCELPASFLSAKIVYRFKASDLTVCVVTECITAGSFSSTIARTEPTAVDVYQNYEVNITVTDLEYILISGLVSSVGMSSTSSAKSGVITFTQIYIEISYDDEAVSDEEVQFYLKKSGVWQSVSGETYKKINGVWATSTLDELSAGDQIVVVEHN